MWRAIPRRLTTPSLFYTRLWWLGNRRVLPPPAWSRKNLSGHVDSFPELPSFLKLQVGNPAGAIVRPACRCHSVATTPETSISWIDALDPREEWYLSPSRSFFSKDK